jgi:hypothetical protein
VNFINKILLHKYNSSQQHHKLKEQPNFERKTNNPASTRLKTHSTLTKECPYLPNETVTLQMQSIDHPFSMASLSQFAWFKGEIGVHKSPVSTKQ